MLEITIDSGIRFRVDAAFRTQHKEFMAAVQNDIEIPNPAYADALRYNRSTRNIPEKIKCFTYDRRTQILTLPRGYWNRLVLHLEQYNIPWDGSDQTVSFPMKMLPESLIELRGYQSPAVGAMVQAGSGVLVAPPGAGKTEMALQILWRLGQPTLWVTHKTDLADQATDRAVSRLGISRKEIGIIGQGKERIADFLTVGLVQTLAKRDLSKWSDRFGAVVVDECHHVPASTWKGVMDFFPARYRYGLTGTPERADGLHAVTELYIGPVMHRIDPKAVRDAGGTITPQLEVVEIETESQVWADYEKAREEWERLCVEAALQGKEAPSEPMMPWNDIIDELLSNPDRNALIAHTIARWGVGHSSLVLTSRIQHAEELQGRLKTIEPGLRTCVIHHQMNRTDRRDAVDGMRSGALDVMFAVEIPKEGLDVPRLDRPHYTSGGKDPIMIQQSTGRIQRPHPGKSDAVVIDYLDAHIPVLNAHHFQRRRQYRKLGMVTPRQRAMQASA